MILKDYGIWLASLSQRELRAEKDNLQSMVSNSSGMSKDTKDVSKEKLKILMDFISAEV